MNTLPEVIIEWPDPETKNPGKPLTYRDFSFEFVVGPAGLEPATNGL